MSRAARNLNASYLSEMTDGALSTMALIRDLWWDDFLDLTATKGLSGALDMLDSVMDLSRDKMLAAAVAHAAEKDHHPGTDASRMVQTQYIKSNTGKMFERFVGLALAHALSQSDAAYTIQGCRKDTLALCHGITREDLRVDLVFGDGILSTYIDADLFAFNPTSLDGDVFLISVKSTLKDRFHNVPFWNLLRRAAISAEFPEITAANPEFLSKVRYVAVCSDLAAEQPDFGTEAGARNLLQIDAALLDGAYVTASKAKGLPTDCVDHLGDVRQHAFYRYSCFFNYLLTTTE